MQSLSQSPFRNSISETDAQALQNHQVVVWDDFLPADLATELWQTALRFEQEGLFQPAGIGAGPTRQVAKDIRSDSIYWLDFQNDLKLQTLPLQKLAQGLAQFRELLNREFYFGLSHFECHLAHYAPGQGYDEHIDQPQKQSFLQGERKVSFVLYLNKNWQKDDGGEFCYKTDTGSSSTVHSIEPLFNRFVFFRSDTVPHSVSSARKDRLSLTGWMRRS